MPKNTLFFVLLLLPILVTIVVVVFIKTYLVEIFVSFLPQVTFTYLFYVFTVLYLHRKGKISKIGAFLYVINLLLIETFLAFIFSFYFINLKDLQEVPQDDKSIKIFSANIHYKNNKYKEILSIIEKNKPDVIFFNEFTTEHFNNMNSSLSSTYKYSSKDFKIKLYSKYGIDYVYSKYPIKIIKEIERDDISFGFAKTVIDVDNKDYDIYNVHIIDPIYLRTFNRRNIQLEDLVKYIDKDRTENMLVIGDFNLSPWSYYYNKFVKKAKLYDITKNTNFEFSWGLNGFDGINLLSPFKSQIDHAFINDNINVPRFNFLRVPGSDHKGMLVEIY